MNAVTNTTSRNSVSHSVRSADTASFAFIEAVRFFAYRFFYYYFFGKMNFLPQRAHMATSL